VNEEALAHWGLSRQKKMFRHLGMYLIWRMGLITNKQAPNNNFADKCPPTAEGHIKVSIKFFLSKT